MKSNWPKFWNFLIQFFIVVLGVFFTLWIGNITEQSKQKRKTKQALETIHGELINYTGSMERKNSEIQSELEVYNTILQYAAGITPLPPQEVIKNAVFTLRRFRVMSEILVSFESTKESGALNYISDYSLIESLHYTYHSIALLYKTLNDIDSDRQGKIINNITPENLSLYLALEDEELCDDTMMWLWNEVTTNPEMLQAVIYGQKQLGMSSLYVSNCLDLLNATVIEIENYLR